MSHHHNAMNDSNNDDDVYVNINDDAILWIKVIAIKNNMMIVII